MLATRLVIGATVVTIRTLRPVTGNANEQAAIAAFDCVSSTEGSTFSLSSGTETSESELPEPLEHAPKTSTRAINDGAIFVRRMGFRLTARTTESEAPNAG
jgi:hypothetical protein